MSDFPNVPTEAICNLMADPYIGNFADRWSPSGWLRVLEDVRRHAAKMPEHEREEFARWVAALNQQEAARAMT